MEKNYSVDMIENDKLRAAVAADLETMAQNSLDEHISLTRGPAVRLGPVVAQEELSFLYSKELLTKAISPQQVIEELQRGVWNIFCNPNADSSGGVPDPEILGFIDNNGLGREIVKIMLTVSFSVLSSVLPGFVNLFLSAAKETIEKGIEKWVAKELDRLSREGLPAYCKIIPGTHKL